MATQNSDYTPQKFTHSSRARFRQTTTDAATAQVEHGEDMTGSFIGPFKIEGFFDRFMNVSEECLQKMNQNVKFPLPSRELKTKDAKLEKNLYQLFVSSMSLYLCYHDQSVFDPSRNVGQRNLRVQPLATLHFLHRCRWSTAGQWRRQASA